jgi:hypothetical protein
MSGAVARDGEPVPTLGPSPGSVKKPDEYKTYATPIRSISCRSQFLQGIFGHISRLLLFTLRHKTAASVPGSEVQTNTRAHRDRGLHANRQRAQ